jgi:hypothetical protein
MGSGILTGPTSEIVVEHEVNSKATACIHGQAANKKKWHSGTLTNDAARLNDVKRER